MSLLYYMFTCRVVVSERRIPRPMRRCAALDTAGYQLRWDSCIILYVFNVFFGQLDTLLSCMEAILAVPSDVVRCSISGGDQFDNSVRALRLRIG
jgi:hypothetical protein